MNLNQIFLLDGCVEGATRKEYTMQFSKHNLGLTNRERFTFYSWVHFKKVCINFHHEVVKYEIIVYDWQLESISHVVKR